MNINFGGGSAGHVRKVHEFVAHPTTVNCVAIGPKTHRLLATGGDDKKVNIWRVGSAASVWSLAGNSTPIEKVCFDPDEQFVVSGSRGGAIKVFDIAEGKVSRSLPGHRSNITSLHYHPFGEFIVSGSVDTNVKIWDVRKKSCIQTYKGHDKDITAVRFSPDGRWVASAAKNGSFKLWDLTSGKLLAGLSLPRNVHVTTMCFNPCEFILACATTERVVRLYDLEAIGAPPAAAVAAGGAVEAGVGGGGEPYLMGCTTPESGAPVRALSFNPSGDVLLSATADTVRAWTWEDHLLPGSLAGGGGSGESACGGGGGSAAGERGGLGGVAGFALGSGLPQLASPPQKPSHQGQHSSAQPRPATATTVRCVRTVDARWGRVAELSCGEVVSGLDGGGGGGGGQGGELMALSIAGNFVSVHAVADLGAIGAGPQQPPLPETATDLESSAPATAAEAAAEPAGGAFPPLGDNGFSASPAERHHDKRLRDGPSRNPSRGGNTGDPRDDTVEEEREEGSSHARVALLEVQAKTLHSHTRSLHSTATKRPPPQQQTSPGNNSGRGNPLEANEVEDNDDDDEDYYDDDFEESTVPLDDLPTPGGVPPLHGTNRSVSPTAAVDRKTGRGAGDRVDDDEHQKGSAGKEGGFVPQKDRSDQLEYSLTFGRRSLAAASVSGRRVGESGEGWLARTPSTPVVPLARDDDDDDAVETAADSAAAGAEGGLADVSKEEHSVLSGDGGRGFNSVPLGRRGGDGGELTEGGGGKTVGGPEEKEDTPRRRSGRGVALEGAAPEKKKGAKKNALTPPLSPAAAYRLSNGSTSTERKSASPSPPPRNRSRGGVGVGMGGASFDREEEVEEVKAGGGSRGGGKGDGGEEVKDARGDFIDPLVAFGISSTTPRPTMSPVTSSSSRRRGAPEVVVVRDDEAKTKERDTKERETKGQGGGADEGDASGGGCGDIVGTGGCVAQAKETAKPALRSGGTSPPRAPRPTTSGNGREERSGGSARRREENQGGSCGCEGGERGLERRVSSSAPGNIPSSSSSLSAKVSPRLQPAPPATSRLASPRPNLNSGGGGGSSSEFAPSLLVRGANTILASTRPSLDIDDDDSGGGGGSRRILSPPRQPQNPWPPSPSTSLSPSANAPPASPSLAEREELASASLSCSVTTLLETPLRAAPPPPPNANPQAKLRPAVSPLLGQSSGRGDGRGSTHSHPSKGGCGDGNNRNNDDNNDAGDDADNDEAVLGALRGGHRPVARTLRVRLRHLGDLGEKWRLGDAGACFQHLRALQLDEAEATVEGGFARGGGGSGKSPPRSPPRSPLAPPLGSSPLSPSVSKGVCVDFFSRVDLKGSAHGLTLAECAKALASLEAIVAHAEGLAKQYQSQRRGAGGGGAGREERKHKPTSEHHDSPGAAVVALTLARRQAAVACKAASTLVALFGPVIQESRLLPGKGGGCAGGVDLPAEERQRRGAACCKAFSAVHDSVRRTRAALGRVDGHGPAASAFEAAFTDYSVRFCGAFGVVVS